MLLTCKRPLHRGVVLVELEGERVDRTEIDSVGAPQILARLDSLDTLDGDLLS